MHVQHHFLQLYTFTTRPVLRSCAWWALGPRLEFKRVNILYGIQKITYIPGHNILELCNVLAQVRVDTSKTKLDI